MGNKNSSNSKVGNQESRVASFEPRMGMPVAKFREEYMAKPKAVTLKGQDGSRSRVSSDNTPLDNDETFTAFIRHAKYKIRTVSHVDGEHGNVALAPPQDDEANARDNQNDQFSNFIQSAKNKLRSTSSKRRGASFKDR